MDAIDEEDEDGKESLNKSAVCIRAGTGRHPQAPRPQQRAANPNRACSLAVRSLRQPGPGRYCLLPTEDAGHAPVDNSRSISCLVVRNSAKDCRESWVELICLSHPVGFQALLTGLPRLVNSPMRAPATENSQYPIHNDLALILSSCGVKAILLGSWSLTQV